MVRQARCDVSDRNDKGSPDTVWQILGSYRGSFSCSETSAAQTGLQHWLREEQPSEVNREHCAQLAKGAHPLLFPILFRNSKLARSLVGGADVLGPLSLKVHVQKRTGREVHELPQACQALGRGQSLHMAQFTPNADSTTLTAGMMRGEARHTCKAVASGKPPESQEAGLTNLHKSKLMRTPTHFYGITNDRKAFAF
ncbi:hypothetical protein TREES_T100015699 [Tupaia chinensis]|uniref:Uncharacterized protein n=1 Tax=Tupaia chinensis TaxID=246437 RepID=L9L781_TUPCH|nr:hypothetical protein TREES_T100015699 [Tupaia chinensis]